MKERKKVEEMEREGRKLKEFLEDYDDERDDHQMKSKQHQNNNKDIHDRKTAAKEN